MTKRLSKKTLPAAIFLGLLLHSQPANSANAQEQCAPGDMQGTYKTSYGPMECEANGPGLTCCYSYAADICQKGLKLELNAAQSGLSGNWVYASGSSGSAEFELNSDCSIANGRWGYAKPTSSWTVSERTSTTIAGNPRMESLANVFDKDTATGDKDEPDKPVIKLSSSTVSSGQALSVAVSGLPGNPRIG